jgi:hypothetical protein
MTKKNIHRFGTFKTKAHITTWGPENSQITKLITCSAMCDIYYKSIIIKNYFFFQLILLKYMGGLFKAYGLINQSKSLII